MGLLKQFVKRLIPHQSYLLGPVYQASRYLAKGYKRALLQDIKHLIRAIQRRLPSKKTSHISSLLAMSDNGSDAIGNADVSSTASSDTSSDLSESSVLLPLRQLSQIFSSTPFNEQDVRITFYGAARKKGNRSFDLSQFLNSVVDHARNIATVEVLLAIDPDDDMDYFLAIKNKYNQKLNFRIYIAETRLGYENLHLYDRILFDKISKNTRMLCDYSDDSYVICEDFDSKLLEIDNQYSDNVYFIHTKESNRDEYLGDVSENILLLYWIMQARCPASYFPIFSRRVLDVALDYAKNHDTNNEWSPVANTWVCDCYIDILSVFVKRLGLDRIHTLNMIMMNSSVVSSFHYYDSKYQLTPNNFAFIKMLNQKSISYMEGLSQAIYDNASSKISGMAPTAASV